MPRTTMPSATSFLGAPVASDPAAARARFAFLGMPFGVPYDMAGVCPPSAGAAEAVRAASRQFIGEHDHYDFDLGAALAADGRLDLVDCGDVAGDPRDLAGTARGATDCVEDLVAGGAMPLVVGGDHGIPAALVAGLDQTPSSTSCRSTPTSTFATRWTASGTATRARSVACVSCPSWPISCRSGCAARAAPGPPTSRPHWPPATC